MLISVLRAATPCRLAARYKRFGRRDCLHLQGLMGVYNRFGSKYRFHLQGGIYMFPGNACIYLHAHKALQLRRPTSISSITYEHRISYLPTLLAYAHSEVERIEEKLVHFFQGSISKSDCTNSEESTNHRNNASARS
jgi:hypothetical protein